MAKIQYPCLVRLSDAAIKVLPSKLADRVIAENFLWAIKADSTDATVCDRPDYIGRVCTCVPTAEITPVAAATAKSPIMTILAKNKSANETAGTLPVQRLLSVAIGDSLTDGEVRDITRRLAEKCTESDVNDEARIDMLTDLMNKYGPFTVTTLPGADLTVEL